MLNFSFTPRTRIHFGKTKMGELRKELSDGINRVLMVYGQGSIKKNGIYDSVCVEMQAAGVEWVELSGIEPNPRLVKVYEGIQIAKKQKVDLVLAVGGGSVIDCAKAIAVGSVSENDVWEYFTAHAGPREALPVGTVLTLAATGSEMNGNAVITNTETQEKLACGSPVMIPAFSILNPEYTFSVDAYNTAAGVVDIMAHIFETYFSPLPACEVQDRMAEALLSVCITYGKTVVADPRNYDARANIMWASTLALNGTVGKGKIGDWICHSIEHEISGLYDISHGVGLAIILPHLMRMQLSEETLVNFLSYGVNVWGLDPLRDPMTNAEAAIDKTAAFFKELGMPATLGDVGITSEHFERIATGAIKRRGTVGRYTQLNKDQILSILQSAL